MAWALLAGLAGFMLSGTFLTQGFTWPLYIQLALTVAIGRYAMELDPDRTADSAATQMGAPATAPTPSWTPKPREG